MYAKRRTRPDEKEKPPRFGIYIAIGVGIILIAAGSWLTYSFLKERILPTDFAKDCERTLESRAEGNLLVILCIKKDGNLFLAWRNLPSETTQINIYRRESGGAPVLWKTVTITGNEGFFEVGNEDDTKGYTFGIEAATASGEVKWTSPNTPSSNNQNNSQNGGQSAQQTPRENSGNIQGQTNPPNGQTTTSSNQQHGTSSQSQSHTTTSSQQQQATTTPPSTYDTSTYIYYTPSGQISGTSSIPTANFWVKHTNKIIEIGWQNIASSSDMIIIYRSKNKLSGYEKLFTQENPITIGLDFIRLDDQTINEAYYYKMEARRGSVILATYGPTFLPALVY